VPPIGSSTPPEPARLGRRPGTRRGSTTDTNTIDRRQHSRYTLALPAYLRPIPDEPVVAVRTTNLSLGGFICLTSAPLEIGWVMHVRVQLTPHEALDCQAQIVRVIEPPEPDPAGASLVAFRFMDLSEAKERQISRALTILGDAVDQSGVPQAYRSRPPAAP
jgi:c-di-GMP-binding flagellar brake protein YcgR